MTGVSNDTLRRWFAPDHLRGPLPEGMSAESIAYPPTPPTGTLEGGEEIDLGDRCLEAIHAPGHSPGGVALWDEHNRVLFTTDVAYPCALLVYSREDMRVYRHTMERLASLEPAPVAVYGSHCDVEMPVGMLAAQRDALAAVVEGMEPTRTLDRGILEWVFDGFTIQLK
jgi:glyoxylase-like metal-dependent hydrolase (beta-lactamase superfamily II)